MALLDPADNAPRWLDWPAVAGIVVVLTAVRLYVSAHIGLSFDESYYTFWSEYPTIGYLDHPPAVAWLIAAGRRVLGNDELGVRVGFALCEIGIAAALYRVGTLLFRPALGALAALLYVLTPVSGLGFLATPDPPSALFWIATLWTVAEYATSGRPAWWLLAGVSAGLGLWSKYTDAFLAPGLLLYLLAAPERRQWLRQWPVWAGAALALVVFSPVLWWNFAHDWASFRFQGRRTVMTGIDPNWGVNLVELLAGQALFLGPLLLIFALVGAAAFALRREPRLALPFWSSLPAAGYFVWHTLHGRVEANWPIPLGPSLTLFAAWSTLELWRRVRWLGGAVVALQLAFGLAITGIVYAQALWQPFGGSGIVDRTTETRGWAKLQQAVETLARDNGARWIATAGNFGVTGELASYALFAGNPLPVRQIDEPERWGYLPPLPADVLRAPALFVRIEPDPLSPKPPAEFAQARLVGVFRRDGGKAPLEAWSAFLVSEPAEEVTRALAP
jgi:4-amino-4-deoxy-L-arabinose transferase-like glycosyltransferase